MHLLRVNKKTTKLQVELYLSCHHSAKFCSLTDTSKSSFSKLLNSNWRKIC